MIAIDMTSEEYEREVRRRLWRRRWRIVAEAAMAVALCATVFAFCWICCAGSGYNWE